jgi:methionine-rich copper-binding protein CopC
LEIRLRFNSRVDGVRSRLMLVLPDHTTMSLPSAPQPSPDVLAASANGLQSGAFVIRWQVLASDGHISRGEVPFHVSLATSGQ